MQKTKAPLAFLLAQVGAHAAIRFGERISRLNLTPPDAGILRMLGASGGLSQQELSDETRHPSQSFGGDTRRARGTTASRTPAKYR